MYIGITGGIACGKSTALSFFADQGWQILDADQLCHEIYNTGEVNDPIRERWGEDFISSTGTPDRGRIAELVFHRKNEREWLEKLIHPKVRSKAKKLKGDFEDIIIAVPLLFEAGWEKDFDAVLSIWSPRCRQEERLRRRGLQEKLIATRIDAQMRTELKLEKADYGIINNHNIEYFARQCRKLSNQLHSTR